MDDNREKQNFPLQLALQTRLCLTASLVYNPDDYDATDLTDAVAVKQAVETAAAIEEAVTKKVAELKGKRNGSRG